jgi:hypothetical protein
MSIATSGKDLGLELAQVKISNFHDHDYVMKEHHEANECVECQEWLKIGLKALEWLRGAEKTIFESANEGLLILTPEVVGKIVSLYEAWLIPCGPAEDWIQKITKNGYLIDNLDAFRKSVEEVKQSLQIHAIEIETQSRLSLWSNPQAEFTQSDIDHYEATRRAKGLPSVSRIKPARTGQHS